MAFSPNTRAYSGASGAAASAAVLDAGLRAYMLRVYNWMASGLLLTGIVAYAIANTTLLNLFYPVVMTAYGPHRVASGLAILSMFAPLAFVLVLSFGVNRLSKTAAQTLYWLFCVAMGASLTNIFLQYTGESVTRVFFITAATFAFMSLWGYTTRSDLSRMGSFMFMGLVGIVIASLVNMFVRSSALQFALSVIGVVVFTGLIAYDTQRIKASYVQFAYADSPDAAAKRSVYDALQLFLNFINLFILLLQLTGVRSNNN
ncbi:MAG: Bax inhibitor-1/YccA family protein [Acidibrevibacterium sp.]|jgi:FtsH-binding integral membrane protein|uniref:Bax inhibitor-1/YccA family protein n=1 Tax=Acidibrevibacterium TaxID=2603324 RepID=UPI0023A9041F|nr:Bax inhibitor-1/YccA family protein [Acidibrevibacterium fodinaquatile]MCA7119016.1 Bax inhibitor-1/YccA family protein [Acidibrevibacterium fodinaquatile]